MTPTSPWVRAAWFAPVALLALYSYWPLFEYLVFTWNHSPQYSHGFLVPVFAAWLLWFRPFETHNTVSDTSAAFLGFGLLGLSLGMHYIGAYIFYKYIECLSLIPCLLGLSLMFGGWNHFRWSWPAIAFLLFMFPLPYRVEVFLGGPLLKVATLGSTFLLQTLGLPAVAEGNTVLVNNFKMGIVEACSGLRMLMTFFAFSTATVLLIRRGVIEKALIIAGSVPIALLTNLIRITFTGIMCLHFDNHTVQVFFHDLAGWFMMPVGLVLLLIELWILRMAIQYSEEPSFARA
jgi:exosortase